MPTRLDPTFFYDVGWCGVLAAQVDNVFVMFGPDQVRPLVGEGPGMSADEGALQIFLLGL